VLTLKSFTGRIMIGRWCGRGSPAAVPPQALRPLTFIARTGLGRPSTRTRGRLLGPCSKTGRRPAFRQASWLAPICSSVARSCPRRVRARCVQTGHRRRRSDGGPHLRARPAPAGPSATDADTAPRGSLRAARLLRGLRFPFSNFKPFALSFQSSFHLCVAVLGGSRARAHI